MTHAIRCLYLALTLLLPLLAACGITGATTLSIIPLKQPPPSTTLRPVRVALVSRDQGSMKVINMALVPHAQFDSRDQDNFSASLRGTLAAVTKRHAAAGEEIRIFVKIQRHLVWSDYRFTAVFAGIDWCAADPADRVLFQEQFYTAAPSCRFPSYCSIGAMKDTATGAAIVRIARKALSLAGDPQESRRAAGTYASYKELAAALADFGEAGWVPTATLFQEQFYATTRCRGLCNLGAMKDETNRAAIRRIAARTVSLASGGGDSGSPTVPGGYDTHDNFDAAFASLGYRSNYWQTSPTAGISLAWLEMSPTPDWAGIVTSRKPALAPK
ncbi:hypothetical protein KP001_18245 [Geomonas subterranea]|uniref:Uncharacterized protein n=1 Tax=Geomonas subterranea TaxID=2847989 RepID=A0ABX8LI29_9BACT|nr:hypothetical protein [Geomonas subterranea]QXE90329.1 hypothetical protein KP001_18245 [Geomonas subterranea]QXM07546.1 hypothetical protein KP002_11045 [Geomonas subterranea]